MENWKDEMKNFSNMKSNVFLTILKNYRIKYMVNLEIVQISAVMNSGPEMMKKEDNFDGEVSITFYRLLLNFDWIAFYNY